MRVTIQGLVFAVAVLCFAAVPAYVVAQSVQASAPSTQLASEGIYSILFAFYVPRILQWLKQQHWFALVQEGEGALNRAMAIVVAFLTSLGIHYSFTHGAAGWSFVIGGAQQSPVAFVAQFLMQFAGQETAYNLMQASGAAKGKP